MFCYEFLNVVDGHSTTSPPSLKSRVSCQKEVGVSAAEAECCCRDEAEVGVPAAAWVAAAGHEVDDIDVSAAADAAGGESSLAGSEGHPCLERESATGLCGPLI